MLVSATKLLGTPILSLEIGGAIGQIADVIIDPDTLKAIAFRLNGGIVPRSGANYLDVSSIREYSAYGMVIDTADELISPDDVVKLSDVLRLNFSLIGLKVESKRHHKLGKVIDYTVTSDDFTVQQIVVKRPAIKSFVDSELVIHRREIVEITDYKIIVKDEVKVLKERAEHEDFVPNFVNPFRKSEQGYAPADTQIPADKDTE